MLRQNSLPLLFPFPCPPILILFSPFLHLLLLLLKTVSTDGHWIKASKKCWWYSYSCDDWIHRREHNSSKIDGPRGTTEAFLGRSGRIVIVINNITFPSKTTVNNSLAVVYQMTRNQRTWMLNKKKLISKVGESKLCPKVDDNITTTMRTMIG